MSLQSTNGNPNIEMIPPNNDASNETSTSTSTLKSQPINSSIIFMSEEILEKVHEEKNEIETESVVDNDTMSIQMSENDITVVELNKKTDDSSTSISKVPVKVSTKLNWHQTHFRMSNHHKNKNGYKHACQKNNKIQYKRLVATMKESKNQVINFNQDDQNSEQKLPQLCITCIDCTSCKKTFLDKFELHKHTTIVHPDVSIKFCHLCDETFLDEVEMQSHIVTVHGQSETIEQHDLERMSILNEFERIEECSEENISVNIQAIDQLLSDSNSQSNIDNGEENNSTEALEFIEETTDESSKSFPYAVKVEIADGESDIYTYTALEEKKEYCSKDFENCQEINETSIVQSEWLSPKEDNFMENTQDSTSHSNEVHIENCLASSMEEFQNIEELETSCEVEYMEKVQHIDQIVKNDNTTCNDDKTHLINDASNQSINESIEFLKVPQDDESSNQELIRILSDDVDTISSPKVPSPLTCRTYSAKINSQILRKPPIKINNINVDEEVNFCIMCREIFSLIEQKSIKENPDTESIFKCPLCSCQFSLRSLLEKHVAYHHLNCECTKVTVSPTTTTTTTITTTAVALEAPISPEVYECVLCPTVFSDYDGLNNHILTLHEPMPPSKDRLTIGKPEYLRTVRCSYMESKMSPIKNKDNSTLIIKIKCPNCELTFLTCDDYLSHMKESHGDAMTTESDSWPSMVIPPTFENSNVENLMNIDTEKEIGINESDNRNSVIEVINFNATKNSEKFRKICKRCNNEFKTVRELSEHLYFSHDDSLESQAIMAAASSIDKENHDWCCSTCSQRFKLLKSYIRHQYFVHNDESMVHICDNCSKVLTSITMVNVHVCLNVSSWECKTCNLSFENGVELRIHNTAEHTEIPGPYICSVCQKRFLTMSMLRRHQQSKKCYPHARPPEKSNVMRVSSKQHGIMKKSRTLGKKTKTQSEKKIKKEYPHLHDLSHMRVIQEDVFIRDAKDRNNFQNKNNHSSLTLTKSEPNDEIYQCSMCKLYFLSKAGLKVHLSRAHTSAVEICQLCYKMFVTGNLVRHITDNHLKHDNNNQSYYKAMRVKLHNTFDIDEHDIERDTEELIATIGTNQLLGLCEYQRFTEQSDNDRFCPDCPLTFDNSEKYRRHYVQTHDKLCALCNMEFETGQEAARHKTRIHGSMACYVWFAHKLIAAISDTKTFSEMAEKIIIETMPSQRNDECVMEIGENYDDQNLVNELVMNESTKAEVIVGTSEKSDKWLNNRWEGSNLLPENSLSEDSMLMDPNYVETQNEYVKNNNDNSNEDNLDDYKLFILVTEDDLEKYKNNVTELAQQIYATCNLFSIDQIERMLEPYAKE